jgi:membrane protein DedA with SNARE-associated domain
MDWIQPLLDWVSAYPEWALILTVLFCFGDALFIVGFLFPSPILLFGVGALVALDRLPLWPAVAAAALGGWLGDLFNYWLGRHFGLRLMQSPWVRRNRGAIETSRVFFDRHGAPGLILGRFIGLIRPNVPMAAGFCHMPLPSFGFWTVISCVLWALAFILPGVALGASLSLAADVAGRLVVMAIAVILLLWMLWWLVRLATDLVPRHAENWASTLLDWSHRHRRLGRLGGWLADPDQPETPGLAILALLLLLVSALWLWLWWGIGAHHPLPVDALAYQTLRNLHTPAGLALATAVAQLGEWPVYLPVAAAMFAVLLVSRRFRAASHWIAAMVFAAVIVLGLTLLLELPDPLQYFRGNIAVRFSGRELVLATVVYGFMPVILSTGRSARTRRTLYGLAVSLIGLIALSQMYLGAQWLSVGIFSVVIGSVWTAALGFGYRRHGAEPVPLRNFLVPVAGVMALAAGLHWTGNFQSRLERLSQTVVEHRQSASEWWAGGYQSLPGYRIDIAGVPGQPLNLQWAGRIEQIEAALLKEGWQRPVPVNSSTLVRWLAHLPIGELPVLPQVHSGRAQMLMLHRPLDDDRQWLLRLWPTPWMVGREPLWIGNITEQHRRSLLRFIQYPETVNAFSEPLQALEPPPPGFVSRRAQQPNPEARMRWDGDLWLLRSAPAG